MVRAAQHLSRQSESYISIKIKLISDLSKAQLSLQGEGQRAANANDIACCCNILLFQA